jgi:hypothetical protein
MSSQTAWRRNSTTHYRRNTLIIAAITAVSTALLVIIPAWQNSGKHPSREQQIGSIPTPTPRAVQTPEAISTPIPVARPTVCGRWRSVQSQKNYDFVCQGQSSFQIRELNGQGQNNTGSGSVGQNGEIQAELLIAKKDRTAHLRLRLSSDGQRLDGTWYGDDAHESGDLSFYRIQ